MVTAALRETARHEAGHAVAAVVLAGPGAVGAAHVVAVAGGIAAHGRVGTGPARSRLLVEPPESASTRRSVLREEGVVRYAGVAAEWCEAPLEEALRVGRALAAVELEDAAEEEEDPEGATEEACERAVRDVGAALGREPGLCVYRLVESSAGDRRGLEGNARALGLRRPANRWHGPSWERACRLVRRHRAAVARVEAALLGRSSLLGREVEELVE